MVRKEIVNGGKPRGREIFGFPWVARLASARAGYFLRGFLPKGRVA